jgi:hypothetical protein
VAVCSFDFGEALKKVVAALGRVLYESVLRDEKSPHKSSERERVRQAAERPERAGELRRVLHQRALARRLEAVRVTPEREGAALHLVRELARPVERDYLRGHVQAQAEKRRLPSHLFAEADESARDAAHGAVPERPRRLRVQVYAAREVEADRGGRAYERRESYQRHRFFSRRVAETKSTLNFGCAVSIRARASSMRRGL